MKMSRPSFRPRPLDIHKKLPIVKSVKDLEDDDPSTTSTTRSSQLLRLSANDSDNYVANAVATNNDTNHVLTKKVAAAEIPTPQFVIVDTYERDYSSTFSQPTSYLRGRGARAELGGFVEYDLDNEDEDWLREFNNQQILSSERFESLLFKFEVLDNKARERAGVITPTLGSPIPILLQLDAADEASQALGVKYIVSQSVYSYWKEKRERWQKPILRRLQPPPPVNDTNPYNVFRPREKAHRLHTRRMQRRENNVQSFGKLRQVRRNIEQAKVIVEALIKREERKRDVMENEVSLQRLQMKYKHKTELLEDGFSLHGYTPFSSKFVSSEGEPIDSDEVAICRPHVRPSGVQNPAYADSSLVVSPNIVQAEIKRQNMPNRWFHKMDPIEPVMLFTKPVVPEKLAAAGIEPPSMKNSAASPPHKSRGRMGRGGRLIFDRWNPLLHSPIDFGNTLYLPTRPQRSMCN